jgi:C-terminal processing protease CtpA/Prc
VRREVPLLLVLCVPLASALAQDLHDGRALTPQGRQNIVAFARLLGYVRFFYPGDSAAHTDWNVFAAAAVRVVEPARDADELVQTLTRVFQPVAPTVTVYRTGDTPRPLPSPPPSPTLGVVYWQHLGLGAAPPTGSGGPRQTVYSSLRRLVNLPHGPPPRSDTVHAYVPGVHGMVPVPDPRQPPEFDLGGGVSAAVPLAVYSTTGYLDDSLPSPLRVPADSTAPPDRALRLAIVASLWDVAQHFYPYFDVVHVNWDSVLSATLPAAAIESDPDRFNAALQRMVAALHDGHGWVSSARNDAVRLFYGHPPIRLGMVEGRIVVTGVEDSAVAAGVRLGEEVLAIDRHPAGLVLADFEARTSGATPSARRWFALQWMGIGPPGTTVTFTLHDPLSSRRAAHEVRFIRVTGPMTSGRLPDKVAELREGIVYVDLGRITDADFTAALPRLESARGIVFDARTYPRSVNTIPILATLSDVPLHSAPFDVPVITEPDHHDITYYVNGGWPVPAGRTRLRGRVAFLIGPGVISYGETTLGIVEAYHLGAMVGSTTAGTNGNVNRVVLPGGFRFSFTGMRVLKHDGTPLHGAGIHPTIAVEPTLRGVRDGRDEVLDRAVAWLAAQR